MKSFQKITTRILVASTIFLICIVTIFYTFYNRSEPKQFVCGNGEVLPVCGTKNLSPKAQEGKQFFNSNCAACHKLDIKSTGPALRNIDSLVFNKWLYPQNTKIDSTKFDKLGIDYHRNLSKDNFEVKDLEKIYAYIGDK